MSAGERTVFLLATGAVIAATAELPEAERYRAIEQIFRGMTAEQILLVRLIFDAAWPAIENGELQAVFDLIGDDQ